MEPVHIMFHRKRTCHSRTDQSTDMFQLYFLLTIQIHFLLLWLSLWLSSGTYYMEYLYQLYTCSSSAGEVMMHLVLKTCAIDDTLCLLQDFEACLSQHSHNAHQERCSSKTNQTNKQKNPPLELPKIKPTLCTLQKKKQFLSICLPRYIINYA